MDKISKEQRSQNMKAIRSKDTTIEIALRHALWEKGIRYRKNCKKLPGKPDIVILKHKLAIFCDSEFWHGKNYSDSMFVHSDNSEYWTRKIQNNVARDKIVNEQLNALGYHVLRFWGKDITKNIKECLQKILDECNSSK